MGTAAPPRAFIQSGEQVPGRPGQLESRPEDFSLPCSVVTPPALSCLVSSFIHSLINPALLSACSALLFYGRLPSVMGKALPLKIRLVGLSESASMMLIGRRQSQNGLAAQTMLIYSLSPSPRAGGAQTRPPPPAASGEVCGHYYMLL